MDLKQFRCFAAVVERGTVTGAAAELRLAQSAVSRHVRALEKDLGVPILDRRRGGMVPTQAGNALYERVKGILGSISNLKDEVGAAGRVVTGRLRFSAPSSIAALLFPPLARQMRLHHPKVQLSFSELVTEAAIRAIRSDGLDVAVVTSLSQNEGLELEPLFDEPLCYVQKSRTRPPDFRSGSLSGDLIMPRDAGWRRQLSIDPTASIVEVDSMQPMAAMVKLGLGAALMPSIVAGYLLDAHLRSTPIPGIKLRRMLAWSAERRPSRAVAEFLAVCRSMIASTTANDNPLGTRLRTGTQTKKQRRS